MVEASIEPLKRNNPNGSRGSLTRKPSCTRRAAFGRSKRPSWRSQQAAVTLTELAHVLLDGRNGQNLAPQPVQELRLIGHTTQLGPQIRHVATTKPEAVHVIPHELRHPPGVGRDHRNTGDERLLDGEGRVLVPETRHNDDVDIREDLSHATIVVSTMEEHVGHRPIADSPPEAPRDRAAEGGTEHLQAGVVPDLPKRLEKQID